MKRGDVLRGFRLTTEPTNLNGGKCVWAFAEHNGREYFVKQFLTPKRPRHDAPDSPKTRAQLEDCAEFEARQRIITDRLQYNMPGGGNLILPVAFFYERSTYYKVTERVHSAPLSSVHSLDTRNKAILLRTMALNVKLLHDIDVVHGDLKPANVLIQQRAANAHFVAKLIDLDDAYRSGDPPGREEIAGDFPYCSPELLRYIRHDGDVAPNELTTAGDVFSLGLLTHHYLTGRLPSHDTDLESLGDALNAGGTAIIDERLSPVLQSLLNAALDPNPADRPEASDFLNAFRDPAACLLLRRADIPATSPANRAPPHINGQENP